MVLAQEILQRQLADLIALLHTSKHLQFLPVSTMDLLEKVYRQVLQRSLV
jgi:hypothetical protein